MSGGSYEAPELVEIGSVTELTFSTDKRFGQTDGFTFQGIPISNASA
jgi:hypothetical protein